VEKVGTPPEIYENIRIKTLKLAKLQRIFSDGVDVGYFKKGTRANCMQNRAMRNLSVSTVATGFWKSPPLDV